MDMARKRKHIDLVALQATNLPRLDWRDLVSRGTLDGSGITDDHHQSLDERFSVFVAPRYDGTGELVDDCIGCGASWYGFTWGMAHGEGHCHACGYPARGYHYDIAGVDRRLDAVLQYHPDELRQQRTEDSES
jgi:hypothetical protein